MPTPGRDIEAAGHGMEFRAEVWWTGESGRHAGGIEPGDEVMRKGSGVDREEVRALSRGAPALRDQAVGHTPAEKPRGDQ